VSIDSVDGGFNAMIWEGLEAALLPPFFSEEENFVKDVTEIFYRFIQFALFLPCAIISCLARFTARSFQQNPEGFAAVAQCSELWEAIHIQEVMLPPLRGAASSEYQYSGMENCPNNQWAEWERENLPVEQQSGVACDLWNRPEAFVQILKNLGMNTFRFSVEWSKIESQEGVFDEDALNHYLYFCKLLKEAGIEPMVTLHHFTDPLWFTHLGGFEKEENIGLFVEFSKIVFSKLSSYVRLWCTINEPGIVAFSGYVLGHFPPNQIGSGLSAEVLKNLLKAHCETYRALKPLHEEAQIGLVHQALRFVPYHTWNPLEVLAADYLTRMTHGVVMEFLSSGIFHYQMPFFANVSFEEKEITQLNDFIGVNCYARPLLAQVFGWNILESSHYPHEAMTQMEFREDPAAIYEALREMHEKTGKPLFVTEVGISTEDEEQYQRYMLRALYAIAEAMKEGVDVQGIYVWSLMKNFEWNLGWGHNFGLCDQEGHLRQGAQSLPLFYTQTTFEVV